MSEGANETAVSFVASPSPTTTTTTTTTTLNTTLECLGESKTPPEPPLPPPLPPPPPPLPDANTSEKTTHVRKHRKLTGRTFHLIDGKKIRSALTHKIKWPPRDRRVSFPINDHDLVTGYLEPANPWEHAENVNIEDLISSYKASCRRHGAEPLENLVAQLEKLDISDDERCAELSLKNECLDQYHCEPLEELLKRVQFEKIDVESSSLDDESATILFDMLEYYQSARHLNMSGNRNIGSRGWQSCAQMIKKTTCLDQLEARDITLTQQHMNILKRPLQLVSHLHVLKLENCGLAGRAFVILVSALKMNTGLKELYLADNCFEQEDAIQLGALLRVNNHLQLLDISNNHIKDEGVRDLLDGLIAQSGERRTGRGLSILVLWNNDLTRSSSQHFSEAIAQSSTLETLNIGKNPMSNELLELAQEALIKSRTLLQLGMQSTNLTCKGALLLAGIVEKNRSLQRIDLRDNNIHMEGLAALSFAIKRNPCVTQLDLDSTPWSTKPAAMDQYLDLIAEIATNCARNAEPASTDESTEESGSPQHRSRLSSVSSRKISLTCQTLPRSPPSLAPNSINDITTTRSMLEPKRTSGGRLRSPAPSPIPSPVASPIPSPSRGRFVVSRVCETSLSSTNSSASSSPLTPSSLGSSPTRFFPVSSGGSSRFRVTVVEPTVSSPHPPIARSVVTSANANVTIGFNYKVQAPESSLNSEDDSDSVFITDPRNEHSRESTSGNESSPRIDVSLDEGTKIEGVTEIIGEKTMRVDETKNESEESKDDVAPAKENQEIELNKVPDKIEDNQTVEGVKTAENGASTEDNTDNLTNNLVRDNEEIPESEAPITRIIDSPDPVVIETKVNSSKRTEESLRDEIMACYQSESKKSEPVQRQATSLERLLGLFQHPGSLFSGGSLVERAETRNPLQDGVNSMIALGDKFQQYLRDGGRGSAKSTTDDSLSHPPLQRSVSDASKSAVKADPVKSLSIPQLSSIQATCTRDFVARRETSKLPEYPSDNHRTRLLETSGNSVSRKIIDEKSTDNCGKTMTDDQVPRASEDLRLPENLQTEESRRIEDEAIVSRGTIEPSESLPDRGNSSVEIVDNSSSSSLAELKTTASVCPKLKDIPEYSILETRDTSLKTIASEDISRRESSERDDDNDEADDYAKSKCDSSTTDSINDPSFKNSSHCNVKCDISGARNVHTLGSTGDVHNFLNNPLSQENPTRPQEIPNISTSLREEKNVPVTSEKLEINAAAKENEKDSWRGDRVDSGEQAETSDLESVSFNENEETTECRKTVDSRNETLTSIAADNVDSSFDDTLTNLNDEEFSVERLVEDSRETDTIEEFLPLEATESSNVGSNSGSRAVASTTEPRDCRENNFSRTTELTGLTRTSDEKILGIEDDQTEEEISNVFVRVPSTSILRNEFGITRIAIASIEFEEDYVVQASMEQVSSSLSEDSGYSGKLSVDDVRTGELSLNGSTENSPANDTIEQIVGETSAAIGNSRESVKTTDDRSFVRATIVTSRILSHADSSTSVSSREVRSSESSEDLMFKMTDITNECTAISNDITSAVVTTISVCGDERIADDRYYVAEQSSGSSGNLFIEESSRNVHRNSQDSGIEETTASISDESGPEPSRESLQESVDSGIESECSSVCAARLDIGADVQKERARDPGKLENSSGMSVVKEHNRSRASIVAEILGTKDITRFDDSSTSRINQEIKFATKISTIVLGSSARDNSTNQLDNVVDLSTSPE